MFRYIGLVLITVVFIAGCTVSGNSPVGLNELPDSGYQNHPGDSGQTGQNGPVSWGIWEVTIDPVTGEYEITPLRSVEFIANVTMFLQPPAGSTQNFILTNLEIDMDTSPGFIIIDIDVGLKHPFPGVDQYTGFDVRGIFMHDSQYTSASEPAISYAGPDVAMQLNPDGYSRWMNATEFTTTGILGYTPGKLGYPGFDPSATLNPYKYFTNDLEPGADLYEFLTDEDNLANRGFFTPGTVNYRHYNLIWPEGELTFQYAVIASYNEPDPIPPVDIPDDFPLSANCNEAFHLEIADNGSTAYYFNPTTKGGDLHLNLEVFDWGALAGGTVTDEIGEIVFDSPGSLIASPVTFDPATLTALSGTSVSSVYQIDIPGVNPSGTADQIVLCRVTSAIHDTYDYGFGSDVPEDPLAAYMVFDAPVSGESPAEDPTALAEACTCLWIAPGGSVSFSGAQSFSPNGSIVDWEWDFDGNGTWDDSGETISHTYNSAGDYFVDLRVTDNIGLTDTLDVSEQLHVHIGTYTNPVANAHIVPTIGFINFAGDFEGSGSTGTINLYEWDFEGDCIWDYQHATIGDTTHAYTLPGMYDALLRVSDPGCDMASTPVRMIDPLGIIENGNFWDEDFDPWEQRFYGSATKWIQLETNDTYKWQVHFHRCCTTDGGMTMLAQPLDVDVTEYESLYCNFFFMIDYSNCWGDGYMGGEMDMALRIVYDDGTASAPSWKQAWFGWDTYINDYNPSGPPEWQWDDPANLPSYVVFADRHEAIDEDVWYEGKTCDLMALDPAPITIKEVQIDSRGWDWDTYCALPWFSEE